MKTCSKCGSTLPLDHFGVDRRRSDGLNGWCKACCKEASTRYRTANRDKTRAATKRWRDQNTGRTRAHTRVSILRRYGLSKVDFDTQLALQGSRCAICGNKSSGRALHIDRKHAPGFESLPFDEKRKCYRGLLCANCNRGLGHAQDDAVLLERAAADLDAFEARRHGTVT